MMPFLEVPETGLSLCRDNTGDDTATKSTQIMRLNLAQNTLDELIESLRADQPARLRLGKHQALYYGTNKSQHFHSSSESHRSEIYSNNSIDDELYFTGVLSHSLEVQKAQEATAATDQALANLEQSLSAFERGKESKKTHIITDISEVRALRAGDSRSSTGRQAALLARMPSSKVELEKDRLLKNKSNPNRSISSSPALGVARSPISMAPLTPTSAPPSQNKDRLRLEALKVPFIHLLAIRAVSTKFISRQTRASIEDCVTLAQKYGIENRINPEKFDLRDKVYRELDVWKFPYPSQEDRQEAIENAISAFDRMRLSRSDKLWQSLLPKEERGKGKCLSRLDLRTGPIKKAATPRIQISDEAGKEGDTTSQDTDKSSGSGFNSSNAAPKSGMNTQKKRNDKDPAAKRPTAKSKTAANSTLTGRVTKKSDKKTPSKLEGKFKSAEYVHDSDEDDTDLPDGSSSSEKSQTQQTLPKPKPTPKPAESKTPIELSHVPTPKTDEADARPSKADSSSSSKNPTTKRPPASLPPNQKSPQKPSQKAPAPARSPASTDPPNRSRSSSQNNSTSSSSSSPLITQLSRPRVNTERSAAKQPAKPNGAVKAVETTNSLKRKAEIERPSIHNAGCLHGDIDHKRRRGVSTSSGSTGSASPPLSRELLMQQLREKSQKFKRFYAKYRSLHDAMAAHSNPPRAELEKLQKQHSRLQLMKEEIWDEDRRLRSGL
ncbi:hypothetical protein ASPVEDRAFT_50215 [Aspergillus versicolor CBS 583.65]|uniref:Uncharacterized protein n=1 Tax=Aspergillus versicolor CBS 583.65 TaxID=1036611 RepID=A0A1L9PAG7_ASPVE|nr:uncharacterized protein ASPVEDRAFT_50215 [Aspergillus versicolor CBS 583.65]OJI98527.1 hypothetical protein ASPVEDRAFT_50215 [Aspergillus versicolor CBS 583.65]